MKPKITHAYIQRKDQNMSLECFVSKGDIREMREKSQCDFESSMRVCHTFQKLINSSLWQFISDHINHDAPEEAYEEMQDIFKQTLQQAINTFDYKNCELVNKEAKNDN